MATNSGTLGLAANGYYVGGAYHPSGGALVNGTGAGALFLDTPGNRVVVPYQPSLANTNPFSVEFWASPNALSSGDGSTMCLVSWTQFGNPPGAGDGTRKGWLFYQNAGTGFTFRTYGAGNAAYSATVSSMSLSPGSWYHIVGVYDGTNTTL
ncbi:MAG TPA: LamG-like jellyroll fold domain-containing protein [Verrucomicrobiae bacterium]